MTIISLSTYLEIVSIYIWPLPGTSIQASYSELTYISKNSPTVGGMPVGYLQTSGKESQLEQPRTDAMSDVVWVQTTKNV